LNPDPDPGSRIVVDPDPKHRVKPDNLVCSINDSFAVWTDDDWFSVQAFKQHGYLQNMATKTSSQLKKLLLIYM